MSALVETWQEANQRWLVHEIARLRARIELLRANSTAAEDDGSQADDDDRGAADDEGNGAADDEGSGAAASTIGFGKGVGPWSFARPPAIEAVCATFGLTPFERDLLLLFAAVELDAGFCASCAALRGAAVRSPLTLGFALAALEDAHWSALAPSGALRRWHLIQMVTNDGLTQSGMRIDERVLHFVVGVDHIDQRLAAVAELLPPVETAGESAGRLRRRVAEVLASQRVDQEPVVLQLCGSDSSAAFDAIAAACWEAGCDALRIRAHDLPAGVLDRASLCALADREAALIGVVPVVDCSYVQPGTTEERHAVAFIEDVTAGVMAVGPSMLPIAHRSTLRIDIARTTGAERRAAWQDALGTSGTSHANGAVERLAAHFDLPRNVIRAIAASTPADASALRYEESLWDCCRLQSRSGLDALAERIEPAANWEDLVLPQSQLALLREVAVHVRQHVHVFEEWGLGSKSSRGLGTCAVFAGPSGTGKTMAAEVLANDLRLDLYRIDLSRVVNKYIGETEKNLARIFDAGERGGAILLFDEADALFGKRSEVRDSHDRYANIEVSYLLARMESYRGGLAILTTNNKNALDQSFWRRLRFVVQFPFPDLEQRAEIWRRAIPRSAPRAELDIAKLARLNVAGGTIRSMVVNAAFRAADERRAIGMEQLLWAARQEYAKLDRTLSDTEIRGWQ